MFYLHFKFQGLDQKINVINVMNFFNFQNELADRKFS